MSICVAASYSVFLPIAFGQKFQFADDYLQCAQSNKEVKMVKIRTSSTKYITVTAMQAHFTGNNCALKSEITRYKLKISFSYEEILHHFYVYLS